MLESPSAVDFIASDKDLLKWWGPHATGMILTRRETATDRATFENG